MNRFYPSFVLPCDPSQTAMPCLLDLRSASHLPLLLGDKAQGKMLQEFIQSPSVTARNVLEFCRRTGLTHPDQEGWEQTIWLDRTSTYYAQFHNYQREMIGEFLNFGKGRGQCWHFMNYVSRALDYTGARGAMSQDSQVMFEGDYFMEKLIPSKDGRRLMSFGAAFYFDEGRSHAAGSIVAALNAYHPKLTGWKRESYVIGGEVARCYYTLHFPTHADPDGDLVLTHMD